MNDSTDALEVLLIVGVPASGKSTLSATQTKYERVNRDELRTELFGLGYHRGAPVPECEDGVTRVQLDRARTALAAGRSVVVDDANLEEDVRQMWAAEALAVGARFRLWVVDIPLETALVRNARREHVMPSLVVVAMWMNGVADGLLEA